MSQNQNEENANPFENLGGVTRALEANQREEEIKRKAIAEQKAMEEKEKNALRKLRIEVAMRCCATLADNLQIEPDAVATRALAVADALIKAVMK